MADVAYRLTRSDVFTDPFWVQLPWLAQGVEAVLRKAVCGHGRYPAAPLVLKRGPLAALSLARIRRALDLLGGAGIIERYTDDGQDYLWFPDTDLMHSETYLKRDRPWSPYPAPPGYVDPRGEPPPRRRRSRTLDQAANAATSPGVSTPGEPSDTGCEPGDSPGCPGDVPGAAPVEPGDEPGMSPDESGGVPVKPEPEPELPLPASRASRAELDRLWSDFCRNVDLLRAVGHPLEELDETSRTVWETTIETFDALDHRAVMAEWLSHWSAKATLDKPIRSSVKSWHKACELGVTKLREREEREAQGRGRATVHRFPTPQDLARRETDRELAELAESMRGLKPRPKWTDRVQAEIEGGAFSDYSKGLIEQLQRDEELNGLEADFLTRDLYVAGVDEELVVAMGHDEAIQWIRRQPRYMGALHRAAQALVGATTVRLVVGGSG